MTSFTRDIQQHQQVTHIQGTIMRTPSPWFAPAPPAWMRSPGTNWVTTITAPNGGGVASVWKAYPAS